MPHPAAAPFARAPAVLVAVLIGAMALSGCLGDDDPAPSTGSGDATEDQPAAPAEPEDELEERVAQAKENNEQVPEAHYHHYWGTPPMPAVTIFEGEVELTADHCTDSDAGDEATCIGPEPRIGSVTFDLEDDGDDIPADERRPSIDGHADTVFTGTSEIQAEFSWDPAHLGNSLLLYYKPANSPVFFPLQGDPITVSTADPKVTIPLSAGMADPAHQFRVSRWAFKLVADSGPHEEWPGHVYAGTGPVEVSMSAINGGKQAVDPPHPDIWAGRDTIEHGEVSGSFTITQVHAETDGVDQEAIVRGEDHEGIKLPLRAVIPTGTQKLVVTATVTATDATSDHMDWGLKWHGANDATYIAAEAPEDGENGARIYTIPIDDYIVDPPYVAESFFEFGFYPIGAGQDGTGNYEADYTLSFTIHKDPKFTYFF